MKEILNTILKFSNIIVKVIPTILSIIEDLADDGRLNRSNKPNPPLNQKNYEEEIRD